MKRRNPSAASLPNVTFDLTPLLDVIFIFLFVVIIGYTVASQTAQAEAEASVQEMRERLETLQNERLEEQTVSGAEEERLSQYEALFDDVRLVTVYSTYEEENPRNRMVSIKAPKASDEEMNIVAPFPMNTDNEEMGYQRIQMTLEEYINTNPDTIIVLSINKKNIIHKDFMRIREVLDELAETRGDIYVKVEEDEHS